MHRKQLVRDRIREKQTELTAAERKLTTILQDDSQVAGLQSITKLAKAAGVSTPTVIRLARKLGFDGFPDLQNAIREDVAERIKEPLAKLQTSELAGAEAHILSRFAVAVSDNINRTMRLLDLEKFDAVAKLLADRERSLFLLGGRITRSNAHYFYSHLQILRPNVQLCDASPSVWPQTMLDANEQSVLVVFDIRRYERGLERLVKYVKGRGTTIILFTDQWGSPIEKYADIYIRNFIEVPSSWDSTLSISFVIEALLVEIQKQQSEYSVERIEQLESMISDSRIF